MFRFLKERLGHKSDEQRERQKKRTREEEVKSETRTSNTGQPVGCYCFGASAHVAQ